MREDTGRACGKVILLGEHAVVYGVPAIAVGIERGATASVKGASVDDAPSGPSRLSVSPWGVRVCTDDADHDLARALAAVLEASGIDRAVHVEAHASLPP